MTVTLIIAIYGAVVATGSLIFNYLRDPQPYLRLTSNHISWGSPTVHTWSIHISNQGEGSARNVRIKIRRGKRGKWTEPQQIIDILKPPTDAVKPMGWWSADLTDGEYEALADPKVRDTWKAKIIWQQGPVRFVGRRTMKVSPDTYREPMPFQKAQE